MSDRSEEGAKRGEKGLNIGVDLPFQQLRFGAVAEADVAQFQDGRCAVSEFSSAQ